MPEDPDIQPGNEEDALLTYTSDFAKCFGSGLDLDSLWR